MRGSILFFTIINFCFTSYTQEVFEFPSAIKKVTIYDLLGKQIMSFTSDAQIQTLDVSPLTSGIYVVAITTESNLIAVKKLVKK